MFAAFKRGDLDGVMAHVAEDIELLAPSLGEFPWGGTISGGQVSEQRVAEDPLHRRDEDGDPKQVF